MCVCKYCYISLLYLFIFFVDLALNVENLDDITESRMLGRVLLHIVG